MSILRDFVHSLSRFLVEQRAQSSGQMRPSFDIPGTSSECCDTVCHNPEHIADWDSLEVQQYLSLCSGKQCSWVVPFAGNAFESTSHTKNITSAGVANWKNPETKISLFVHCFQPESFLIGLRLRVPSGSSSKIRVLVTSCTKDNVCQRPQSEDIFVRGNSSNAFEIVPCGNFSVSQEGYMKFELVGLNRTGAVFADVSHAILIPDIGESNSRAKRSIAEEHTSNSAMGLDKSCIKFVENPDDFYFGRRGPSVHLNYDIPRSEDGVSPQVEYFYNEVIVPAGQDVVGSYFCAIGFSGGYFGIQVNSATERRVLFSIWSAYNTDNPSEIPQDYKVTLIRKGRKDVHVGEFGNEGSGGQSYFRYSWKATTTYKFLVQAKPLDENNTLFSAWFCDSGKSDCYNWTLVASFKKPKVSTYLHGLYSFSENFIPEMGHVERQCMFGNQWVIDTNGRIIEVTKAKFTADATATKENRKDVAGGVVEVGTSCHFYLRNCGFFSDIVDPGVDFCRKGCGKSPNIDISTLP